MTDEPDPEFIALNQIIEAMETLPKEAHARVVAYVIARFGIDLEDL